MKQLIIFIFIISAIEGSLAQRSNNSNLDKIAEKHAIHSFREFYDLLSIPNDAHHPADIEKNVQWCEAAFAKRGFTTQRLNTATIPLLLAERKVKNPKSTVLIYLQIDGQPVNPSQWNQESMEANSKRKRQRRQMEHHCL